MDYSKLIIAGRLGGDPQMRYVESRDGDGRAVTNFSVATNQGYGDNKRTFWVRVACWGKLAEVANQYLHKGDGVLIESEDFQVRNYTTKAGEAGSSFEVTARRVVFGDKNGDRREYEAGPDDKPVDEELPF